MTKRIISTLLAFVLIVMSLFILGVAMINVIELLGETIGSIVDRDFSYYISNRISTWLYSQFPRIGSKIITSIMLFFLAIFIISYKETKIWGIVRKVFGVLTSLSIVAFIVTKVIAILAKFVYFVLEAIYILSDLRWIFRQWYYYNYGILVKNIWSLAYQNAITIFVIIIAFLSIAYILYLSFKKTQTCEQMNKNKAEKKKVALEKKLAKIETSLSALQNEAPKEKAQAEEKSEAKVDAKADVKA